MSTLATIVKATKITNGAFVSNIEVFDTLSGTNNCTDPSQWFIISTELFVPAGNNDPITLSVPESFGNLPNGSFPLKSKNNIVGSIANSDSNNFTVTFQKSIPGNITTTFNFLTKLTSSAQKKISSPQTLNYVFTVSTGDSFESSINFIPKDVNKLSSNGGIYSENNTAWFIADIPISSLNQASRFSSKPAVASSFEFNTSLTTYEIVVKVDDLNRPISTVPFTALKDQSDSSQISLYINTKIDGGEYLRIKYYSQLLSTASVGTTVSLKATNSENTRFSKRDDDSQTLTTNYYSGNETNVEDTNGTNSQSAATSQITTLYSNSSSTNNETYETYSLIARTDSAIVTQIGTWIPITTLTSSSTTTSDPATSSSTSDYASISESSSAVHVQSTINSTATAQKVSSISESSSVTDVQSTTNSTTTAQEASTSLISTSSSSATSNTTLSIPSSSSASILSTSRIGSNLKGYNSSEIYESYSVITLTNNGQLTSFTSWFAISTEASSTSSPTIPYTASSATPSSTAQETASHSVSTTVKNSYETYSLITITRDGKETVSTSWFPISTFSRDGNQTATSTSSIAITQSASEDSYETYSLVTLTKDGKETVSTSWFAISTISHVSNKPSASASSNVNTKSNSEDPCETYSLVTLTKDGKETVSTSWFPMSTISGTNKDASTSSTSMKESIEATTIKARSTVGESSAYETYLLTTKLNGGEATVSTNWYAISTAHSSTRSSLASTIMSSSGVIFESQEVPAPSKIQTSFTSTPSIELQLSTSVASNSSSIPSITIYEGYARRSSISIGGIFSGILLITLQLLR